MQSQPTNARNARQGQSYWRTCRSTFFRYIISVNRLTKQEQLFLVIVLGLLLTGWMVKAYRTAHPPTRTIQEAKP
jgi:hypothetical protein